MKRQTALFALFLAVMLLGSGLSARAENSEESRDTLRGLPGVHVSILANPLVDELGPTLSQVQTDVELKLRKAGIKVFSVKEGYQRPGRPVLEVSISFLCMKETCVHSILVSLLQSVDLTRDNTILNKMAVTWSTGTTGFVDYRNASNTLRQVTQDHVDEFINAYLSVTAKKTL